MLPSPFIIRKELTAPAAFYGRKHEIDAILSYLNKDNPQNVQVIGQRRIGKTFLLQYLTLSTDTLATFFGEQLEHFTIVYWNLARRPPETPQQFYLELIRTVRAKLPSLLREVFLLEAASEDELDDVMDEALQALEARGHHIVLLLDEFSIITANPAYPATFFSRLRTLAEGSALAFVIATHRPLSELCHSGDVADSPFFNIFTRLPIRLLDEEEATAFLTGPFAERGIAFEKGALAEALRVTGGHPAVLATMGDLLWKRMRDAERISHPRVASLSDELYVCFEEDFAYYWRHLPEPAQQVAAQVAAGEPVPWPPTSHRGEFDELASKSITRLSKGRILLFSPLFATYIERHSSKTADFLKGRKEEARYYPYVAELFRARLHQAPQLPREWNQYLEFAINCMEDHPEQACYCCGRTLFRKILQKLSSRTGVPLQNGEGSSKAFLQSLEALFTPAAASALPVRHTSFNRIAHHELWYLKHLGDCGAHADEYDLSPREAAEVIFIAITLCQRLVLEGY